MAILIAKAFAVSNGTVATTPSMVTTGATALIVVVTSVAADPTVAITDSKSNTWTARTAQVSTGQMRVQIFDSVGTPTVGTGHTITGTSTSGLPTIEVMAWSGVTAFDQQNGASSTGASTLSDGGVTPTQAGELIVIGYGDASATGTKYPSSPFAVIQLLALVGGVNYTTIAGFWIQGVAATIGSTWTAGVSTAVAAVIASYKTSSSGGGGTTGFASA